VPPGGGGEVVFADADEAGAEEPAEPAPVTVKMPIFIVLNPEATAIEYGPGVTFKRNCAQICVGAQSGPSVPGILNFNVFPSADLRLRRLAATRPLIVTVLVAPKSMPETVTVVPTGPLDGAMETAVDVATTVSPGGGTADPVDVDTSSCGAMCAVKDVRHETTPNSPIERMSVTISATVVPVSPLRSVSILLLYPMRPCEHAILSPLFFLLLRRALLLP